MNFPTLPTRVKVVLLLLALPGLLYATHLSAWLLLGVGGGAAVGLWRSFFGGSSE